MKIDYIHGENMGKRFIRKDFKCLSCFRRCKKLVHILINKIQCPYCYSDNCQEILFIKGNNDNSEIDSSSLKTNISIKDQDLSLVIVTITYIIILYLKKMRIILKRKK